MTIKLDIQLDKKGKIPFNYNYALSSWLYRTLQLADRDLASLLHECGLPFKGRTFKLMTYGPLDVRPYEIDKKAGAMVPLGSAMSFELRFFMPSFAERFIAGLFQAREFGLRVGANSIEGRISSVKVLNEPEFQGEMAYRTVQPICIGVREPDKKHPQYLSPLDSRYCDLVVNNLISKFGALLEAGVLGETDSDPTNISDPEAIGFKLDSDKVRSKLLTVKEGKKEETRIRGYHCRFRLKAPSLFHRIAYYSGLGEKNSLGMGMIKVA